MAWLRVSKGARWEWGIAISLAVILAPAEIRGVLNAPDGVTPSAGVTDMRSILAEMPRPESAYELPIGESPFTEFVGPLPSAPMALPSGPPAYVFDSSNHLVVWSCDSGDNPDFD